MPCRRRAVVWRVRVRDDLRQHRAAPCEARRAGRALGKGQDQIDIIYTGLRPGEKLHEELTLGDEPKETSHPFIRRCTSKRLTWTTLEPRLHRLEAATDRHDVREARRLVESLMPDYRPLKNPTSSLHEQGQ
mgnify:CR=1 FL=1